MLLLHGEGMDNQMGGVGLGLRIPPFLFSILSPFPHLKIWAKAHMHRLEG